MQIPALTPRTTSRRIASILTVFGAAVFALPQTASAGAFLPDSAQSPVASKVNLLYVIVFVLGLIAILGVVASLVRATRSDGPGDAAGGHAQDGSKGVMVGAIVVAVLFAVLGSFVLSDTSGAKPSNSGVGSQFKATPYTDPSLKIAHEINPPKGPAISVHINGQRYLWRYSYPGFKDTYSYHTMVVPVGVTTLLDVTSSDVEHAWWVPQLGGSIDALPGYINKGWIRVDKAGVYKGASTVISGTNYASMTTSVVALPPAQFLLWVAGKNIEISKAMAALLNERNSGEEQALISGAKTPAGAATTAPPAAMGGTAQTGAAPDGKAIFASAGCAGCHVFTPAGSTGKAGPSLDEIAKEGNAAVKDAIVNPNAEIFKGYKKGVMPTTFSKTLSKAELAALITYITSSIKSASGGTTATTTPAPAPNGKAIFASAGCAGCHVFTPAGSTGKAGPNLDAIAKEGNAPVMDAIVNPNAEIFKGYKKGIMPTTFSKTLSKAELAALVKYITTSIKSSGAGK